MGLESHLFDSMPFGIIYQNNQGEITEVNLIMNSLLIFLSKQESQ